MTDANALGGRVAVVTGASRGIGAAIAEELAGAGAHVVLAARTVDPVDDLPGSLSQTAARIAESGGAASMVAVDLTDSAARQRLADATLDIHGRVDILVNNAAVSFFAPALALPRRRWELMAEVQVIAAAHLLDLFGPGMLSAGAGTVVNVTSRGARLVPGPPYPAEFDGWHGTAYGTCKVALELLTVAAAARYGSLGVCVMALAPTGIVPTPGSGLHNDATTLERIGIEPPDLIARSVRHVCATGTMWNGRVVFTEQIQPHLIDR